MSRATLYVGGALEVLRTLPQESAQCCVTSPPYWGLRDYGVPGQLGLESTPEEYVAKMVEVFRGVWRVLRDDGTLWLNLGDCYAGGAGGRGDGGRQFHLDGSGGPSSHKHDGTRIKRTTPELKTKDLVGIPWRVAFALQADGWYLRSDIIWSKPNPMPESVTDRPTKAHEYVFLLSKSQRYYYDAKAIKRPSVARNHHDATGNGNRARLGSPDTGNRRDKQRGHGRPHAGFNDRWDAMSREDQMALGANARTVWEIATAPYPEAHFATFPPELAARCIKVGSKPTDTILDPFGGSGTTAAMATGLGRKAIHIDLNPQYLDLAVDRIGPLLCDVKELAPRLSDE